MRRGDVVIAVIQGDYGKPRPGVIVQDDLLNSTHPSFLVCPCTTDILPGHEVRPLIEPTPANGLRARSKLMVDKLAVVPRAKVKEVIGHLEPDDLARLNWALMLVLGLP